MTGGETETFGALLRRHRLAAGLSQEALAERARLSATAIAALERGRRTTPRPDTISLLAQALALPAPDRAALIAAATGMPPYPSAAPPESEPPAPHGATVPLPVPPAAPLPLPPTALIGREREEAAVTHLLQRGPRSGAPVRLLTLLGTGGVGKTRLALAVAWALQETYAGGAVFVDLAPLRDHALVAATIVQALGIHQAGARSAQELLAAHLRTQHLLLVLDNFEQVTEAAPLVAHLVAACPHLAVLVTSRTALRVRAEQQFRVPPLAVPTSARPTVEEVGGCAAVRLFVERAQAVQPAFELSAANVEAVAQICRRLDGIPLAIGLAAAWVPLLPPRALLNRLSSRLGVLTRGAHDLPARQQTLRAAIDWSYDLLSEQEQTLFRRIGIFSGGATLEAVEAICLPSTEDAAQWAGDVLDGVASLLDKSLLLQTTSTDEPRFGMLETLREYARERLESVGEITSLRRAHATYFLTRAEESLPAFRTRQKTWLERWEREHDNVRAALDWARESGEIESGLRLAGALWRFWYLRGHLSEGMRWLGELLDQPAAVAPPVRAEALRGAAGLASEQGDLARGAVWCQGALALYREMGDGTGVADTLNLLGNITREQGAYDRATAFYEDSLALCQERHDTVGVAVALNNLGTTARAQGDLARARALYEQSLALRRETDDQQGIARTLSNLGNVARAQGDLARAAAFLAQSLALCRDLGHKQHSARALIALGDVARLQGDTIQATARYTEGLALSHAVDDRWQMAFALEGMARIALARGAAARAVRLLARVALLREQCEAALLGAEQAAFEDAVAAARSKLAGDAFADAWHGGETQPLERFVDETIETVEPSRR